MNVKRVRRSLETVAQIHGISIKEVICEVESYLKEAREVAYREQNLEAIKVWGEIIDPEEPVEAETVLAHILEKIVTLQ